MNQPKVLIWDFDGTLAQRMGGWANALVETVQHHAPEAAAQSALTPEMLRPFLRAGFPWHAPEINHTGQTAEDWWTDLHVVFARAYQGAGVSKSLARTLAPQVRHIYLQVDAWQVFADTQTVLAQLSALGWKHLLLSNHVPELPTLLDALDLARPFQAVFNSAQTGWEKPNPHAFRQCLDYIDTRLGRPAAVWMIGDSHSADVVGAAEAGLPAILVHTPPNPGEHACATLSEIIPFLSRY